MFMMLIVFLVFDFIEFVVKFECFEVVFSFVCKILGNVEDVKEFVDLDFNCVIYLGVGFFFGFVYEV